MRVTTRAENETLEAKRKDAYKWIMDCPFRRATRARTLRFLLANARGK